MKQDPFRSMIEADPRPEWREYFHDYALAFGLVEKVEDCAWLDSPEYERAAKYADDCRAEDRT